MNERETASDAFPGWLHVLAGKLDALGIAWCFLREPDIVAADACGGDELDLWVKAEHLGELIEILAADEWLVASGSATGGRITGDFAATVRFKYPQFEPTPGDGPIPGLTLEVHCGGLKWRSFAYLDLQCVATSIERRGDFSFVGGAALLAILADRVVIRAALRGERLARARRCRAGLTTSEYARWQAHATELFGARNASLIGSWLVGDAAPTPVQLRQMALQARLRRPAYWPELARKLVNVWRRTSPFRRATTVCVLGTDGAGKSTMIDNLIQYLNRGGALPAPAISVYWGRARGNTRFLDFSRSLLNRRLFGSEDGPQAPGETAQDDATSGAITGGRIRSVTLVAAVSYVVDYWIRYVTQVLPLLGTHRFVLIDRGPLDISLMPGPTALLAKLSRLGPAMFLNVLCSAGVETIMQRKNERSAAEVVHHQATLRELVLSSPRGVVIDTEHTMERVTLIAAVVVRASRALHHGWLDGAVYRMILDGLTTTDTKSGT